MAVELGSAFISVGLGTNSLAGDIKKAFGASGDAGETAGKEAGSRFGGAVGIAAAAVGALGIGSFFKSAISGAGDLEQSVGAIDSVFKGSAGQMHEWANSAATDVGLSADEFNELGTLIGSQLKNGGTAMDQLGPKTKELISTGADLASMFGGTTSEAVDALSSALKGERDPIEKYGVSLNQAKIDAEAAALGFGKVNGAFDQSAQQAATLSLITKQTADATGNFGRETDTLAHKQQVLNAQLANGKARIGTELLPAVAALTGALSAALGPAINVTVAGIKTVVGGFTAFGAAFKAADGDVTSSGFAGVMERIGFVASQMWAGLSMGAGVREQFAGQLSGLVAFGAGVRSIFDQVVTSAKILAAGFQMPLDAAAGFGDKLNPLLAVGVGIRQAFSDLWAGLTMPAGVAASIGVPLEGMVAIGSSLRQTFDTVIAGFQPLLPTFAALIPQLFALFQALSPTSLIFQVLAPVLPQIAAALMGVIAAVLPLVLSLTSQLLPIITQLVSAVLPPLISIFADVIGAIAPLIVQIAGLLIPIIMALMPVVVTVFSVVAEVIKAAMQIVQGIIQVVTGIISGDWDKVWTGIQNIFSGIWNTIVAVVRGALQIVGQVVISGLAAVGGFASGALSNIGQFFADTWANVVNGVSGMIGDVTNFFSGLGGKITGAMGDIGSTLYSTGVNIIQGLINGIGSMMGAIGRAVLNIVPEAIRGPFEQLLGIHSPSRVFRGYGVNIGQGLILGIGDMHSDIESAVTGMVTVPKAPTFSAGTYTSASAGIAAPGSGVSIGTVNVRDENEMARLILNKQRDAQAVYGF